MPKALEASYVQASCSQHHRSLTGDHDKAFRRWRERQAATQHLIEGWGTRKRACVVIQAVSIYRHLIREDRVELDGRHGRASPMPLGPRLEYRVRKDLLHIGIMTGLDGLHVRIPGARNFRAELCSRSVPLRD